MASEFGARVTVRRRASTVRYGTNTGGGPVGQFDGNVTINGNLNVTGSSNINTTGHAATTTNLSLLGSLRWDLLSPRSSAVGNLPFDIAFDGANMWVANLGSNNVTELRASDRANLGTFPVGTNPFGIAFDGANTWVAN